MTGRSIQENDSTITGRRVLVLGKLASMSRRDVERVIREQGGLVVETLSDEPELIVTSDEAADVRRLASDESIADSLRNRLAAGELELIGETALWARLGLVDSGDGIERLYTAAMLAELVHAPIAAIRQWQRRGAIVAQREVQRLAYFDFEEVPVARKLAQLLAAGCTLSAINRRLDSLARLLPGVDRPLADPSVVVEGRQLVVRRDDGLAEPTGQMLLDFDMASPTGEAGEDAPATISMVGAAALHKPSLTYLDAEGHAAGDLRELAAELEGSGQLAQAADAYRAAMFSSDSTADDHFALAELLYQAGDLAAARERYYMAIELDEDFVEARSNLGCVLAELGETGLAEAAFRGALEYHPDYADTHYHLARLLDRVGRRHEAACHWQLFMSLAPASPWADEARERIGAEGERGSRGEGEASQVSV